MPQIEGWSKDIKDRMTFNPDNETLDELVMTGANVHLEQLSDSCYMLILENKIHRWHLNIYSKSGRAKIVTTIYEDGK